MKKTYPLTFLIIALLLMASPTWSSEEVHCSYVPNATSENPQPELQPFEACGKVGKNGNFVVSPSHLKNAFFDIDGFACFYVQDFGTFYVRESGKTQRTRLYDNGCDYFSEGLARADLDAGVAFFNKGLKIIFRTEFDDAFPFQSGYAAVCNGSELQKNGEHTLLVGGACGYIDKGGVIVVPLKYTHESLPPITDIKK